MEGGEGGGPLTFKGRKILVLLAQVEKHAVH